VEPAAGDRFLGKGMRVREGAGKGRVLTVGVGVAPLYSERRGTGVSVCTQHAGCAMARGRRVGGNGTKRKKAWGRGGCTGTKHKRG
jgi:hypothetical protein